MQSSETPVTTHFDELVERELRRQYSNRVIALRVAFDRLLEISELLIDAGVRVGETA